MTWGERKKRKCRCESPSGGKTPSPLGPTLTKRPRWSSDTPRRTNKDGNLRVPLLPRGLHSVATTPAKIQDSSSPNEPPLIATPWQDSRRRACEFRRWICLRNSRERVLWSTVSIREINCVFISEFFSSIPRRGIQVRFFSISKNFLLNFNNGSYLYLLFHKVPYFIFVLEY